MSPSLRYAWLTLQHKWFVFQAGRRVGVPLWQLIVHDLSKFGEAELPHYGRQFFGDKGDPAGFQRAWRHHWLNNPHHWEYWVADTDTGPEAIAMDPRYIREMVADWLAASRAYEGKWPTSLIEWPWFQKHIVGGKALLHPYTRWYLYGVLDRYFFEGPLL